MKWNLWKKDYVATPTSSLTLRTPPFTCALFWRAPEALCVCTWVRIDDSKMDVCCLQTLAKTKILTGADHHGVVSPWRQADLGLFGVICTLFRDKAVFMFQYRIGVNGNGRSRLLLAALRYDVCSFFFHQYPWQASEMRVTMETLSRLWTCLATESSQTVKHTDQRRSQDLPTG